MSDFENIIKFSEFFERVMAELHRNHGFAAPRPYLMVNTHLLDPIHDNYRDGVTEGENDLRQTRGVQCRINWQPHVESAGRQVSELNDEIGDLTE